MTSEESVNSMTEEQIAESLELTLKCLSVYGDTHSFEDDKQAFIDGASLIRQRGTKGIDRSIPIQRIACLADQLEEIPIWKRRALVYRRAVSIIEQLPA